VRVDLALGVTAAPVDTGGGRSQRIIAVVGNGCGSCSLMKEVKMNAPEGANRPGRVQTIQRAAISLRWPRSP